MPPQTDGEWEPPVTIPVPLPVPKITNGALTTDDTRGLFVIHAVALHTGKLLWFSGHTEHLFYATNSYLFDPNTPGTLRRIPFPPGSDLFCCHYVQLHDGRILTVGGSDSNFSGHGSVGARNVVIFDPVTEGWVNTGKQLLQGRWYPTAVLLPDGRVLVFSGRREFNPSPPVAAASIADWVEVLTPPDYTPRRLTGADLPLPIYPGLHLAPDGKVYFTHTNWGQEIPNISTRALTVAGTAAAPTGSWATFGGAVMPAGPRREEGMSVLLPPAQDGKILVVGGSEARGTAGRPILNGGGGPNNFSGIADPVDPRRAEILSTATSPPRWDPTPGGGRTTHGRINGHLVLLPDRTVLSLGGHDFYKWNSPADGTTPTLAAEIYTPGTGFRVAAAAQRPRMYHSAALLLRDGRVVIAGGAHPADAGSPASAFEPQLVWPAGWDANLRYGPNNVLNRKDYEIYKPPYFFNGTRPTITSVTRGGVITSQVQYNGTFVITTPQAADIREVHLIRLGAATHHTDTEQRLVDLAFVRAGNELTVTMIPTAQAALAPPGFYMLWIVDVQHRPCQLASFVQVAAAPPVAVSPINDPPIARWPCIVATVSYGTPDAPDVVYLRAARDRLAASGWVGSVFVRCVNGAYYSFSPRLAGWLAEPRRGRWRNAVRRQLVSPGTRAIAAAERAGGDRLTLFAAELALLAVAFAVVSPVVLAAVVVDAALGGEIDG